jgi:hypothetical protein
MEATDNAQPIATTPRRRMRATRYELFARNGHLVLRCHSPDAIGGFYNLDIHREPNAIVLRNMRKRGEALANRYRVGFIDTTGDIVMPDIPEPERRKQEETTTDGTSLSAIRHRARRRGLVFSKSRKDGGLYRLAMADGSILLGANFDATLDEVQAFLAAAEEAREDFLLGGKPAYMSEGKGRPAQPRFSRRAGRWRVIFAATDRLKAAPGLCQRLWNRIAALRVGLTVRQEISSASQGQPQVPSLQEADDYSVLVVRITV